MIASTSQKDGGKINRQENDLIKNKLSNLKTCGNKDNIKNNEEKNYIKQSLSNIKKTFKL